MPEDEANAQAINEIDFNLDDDEATDVKEQVEQKTTSEESSAEEDKSSDAEETTETEESEDDQADKDEKSEDSEETTEEPKQKGKNNAQERIRSLANENRELKRIIEATTAQAYQPKTAQQLQEQGMDEASANVEAFRQEQAVRDYNQHVTQLNADLNMESLQVMHDMPIFDESSKEYDKEFADEVAALYSQVAGFQTDPNTGQIIQANVLPYDFYKKFDTIRKGQVQKGELQGKKNARKSMAAAEAPSQSSTKKGTTDPLMDALLAD